jgi:hypothetical protein
MYSMAGEISLSGKEKFEIYQLANLLLKEGHSHPIVVEMMDEYFKSIDRSLDHSILASIAEKAIHDKWDILFNNAKSAFAEGVPYFKIKEKLNESEEDFDVIEFIVDALYSIKTEEIELASDSREMKSSGIEGMAKYGLGSILFFFISSNLYLKILWGSVFVISLIIFILGLLSARRANLINQAFHYEQDKKTI